jgi:hypothetical protein
VNPADPLRVLAAPCGEGAHFGPDSHYGWAVWLPVIGPASWLLWRALVQGATVHPAGWTTSIDELAAVLGLGSPSGNQSGIARALRRLDRFGIIRDAGTGVIVVRCRLSFVTGPQFDRLPAIVQATHRRLHARYLAARSNSSAAASGCRVAQV